MAARDGVDVADAMNFMDDLAARFAADPAGKKVYTDVLATLREFKSQKIDARGASERISELLAGHPDLITGLQAFLPPQFRAESGNGESEAAGAEGKSAAVTGHCYCGAVVFSVAVPESERDAHCCYCHCDSCRRAHSAPLYQVSLCSLLPYLFL
jgi:Paired amphipathic helix repeat